MTDTAARPQSITDEFAREWGPRFCAGWNSHDPEQIVKLTTDDVHWEDPFIYPNGALHGQVALGEWIASILRAFGDVEFQVVGQPLIALDRSRLMFEWVGTSRMTGALDPPGFAPTGGMVEFRGIDTHDFRDDLLSPTRGGKVELRSIYHGPELGDSPYRYGSRPVRPVEARPSAGRRWRADAWTQSAVCGEHSTFDRGPRPQTYTPLISSQHRAVSHQPPSGLIPDSFRGPGV